VVKPYQDEELINILNSLVYGATVQSELNPKGLVYGH